MSSGRVGILPSILSADFCILGQQIAEVDEAGADGIHVDVMDGRFVPNITIGPLLVEAARRSTRLPLDVHLMIVEPERYLEDFAEAGADTILVHQEACPHLHRTVQQIKSLGSKAGVVLNPATPLATLEDILPDLDQILIMSVNHGIRRPKLHREQRGKGCAGSSAGSTSGVWKPSSRSTAASVRTMPPRSWPRAPRCWWPAPRSTRRLGAPPKGSAACGPGVPSAP